MADRHRVRPLFSLIGAPTAGALPEFLLGGVALHVRAELGAAVDWRATETLWWVAVLMMSGSVGFVLLGVGTPALYPVGVILAFAFGWGWVGLFNLSVILVNRAAPGAATGITQVAAYTGAICGPAGFALIAEQQSYAAAWAALGACCFAGGLGSALGHHLLHPSTLALAIERRTGD